MTSTCAGSTATSSSESPAYRHASGTSNDLSTGIFETIDMGSYRVEEREVMKIALADYDGALGPIPTSAPGHAAEPKLGRLSNIVRAFNDQFGNTD